MLTSRLLLAGAFSAIGALAAFTLPAQAAPVFIDFEAVPNSVNNLATQVNPYSANVQFVKGAISMTSSWPGSPNGGTGAGNFFRDPAKFGSGTQGAVFMSGENESDNRTSLIFNVEAGFTTAFSMLYSADSTATSTSIKIFDGLNGQGQELARSDSLEPTVICPVSDFACQWQPGAVNFSGTAKSVVIHGRSNAIWLDDFRLGANDGGTIPEPGGVALSLAALGALALGRKKQQVK